VGTVLALLAAAWLVVAHHRPDGVNWTDPDSVAGAFVRRYATHDATVCELVTTALRGQMDREGRCSGPARGTPPRVVVLDAQTCGNVHHVDAAVTPEGEIGKRFVSVGLERSGGTAWLVRSVIPIADCRVIASGACEGAG
jgi:hypothetical protein